MHEQRVRLGARHQRLVHLIGAQLVVPPFAGRLRIMHADPCIGHDKIGPLDSPVGIALDGDVHALGAGLVDEDLLGVQRRRAGEHQVEPELSGRMGKAGKDIVAVAGPDHLAPADRAAMLFEGHDIGHDLAGMGAVGQPVDHRNRRMFGHLQKRRLLEGADHDHVHIARQHAGRIGNGLAMAKLHVRPGQDHGLPAHLAHPDIE